MTDRILFIQTFQLKTCEIFSNSYELSRNPKTSDADLKSNHPHLMNIKLISCRRKRSESKFIKRSVGSYSIVGSAQVISSRRSINGGKNIIHNIFPKYVYNHRHSTK